MPIVLPPMRDNFFRSLSEATPVMSEASTNGTAMRRSPFMNTVPNGVIQSLVNAPQPRAAARVP